jgi:hypothetical protein
MIVVKHHRGHSGRSVYTYRVYRVIDGPKRHHIQLAKYRTQEAAERAAEVYRKREEVEQ